jgi:hypothetical protein
MAALLSPGHPADHSLARHGKPGLPRKARPAAESEPWSVTVANPGQPAARTSPDSP